jgi:hypothetical protein
MAPRAGPYRMIDVTTRLSRGGRQRRGQRLRPFLYLVLIIAGVVAATMATLRA